MKFWQLTSPKRLEHADAPELKIEEGQAKVKITKAQLSAERCAPEAKVCDMGKSSMNLNAEGIYYPCDGCHGIVLGNAQEQSFVEVWHGEKLQALRTLRNLDFGECAHCENRPWCKVCPTRNFNETADMFCHTSARCRAAQIRRKLFSNN